MLLLRANLGIFMRVVAEDKLHQVNTLPKMKVLTCVGACHGLRNKDSESFHVHCSSEKNGPCSDCPRSKVASSMYFVRYK